MSRIRIPYAAMFTAAFLALLAACTTMKPSVSPQTSGPTAETATPTAQPSGQAAIEASAFVDSATSVLEDLSTKTSRAGWVQATYITDDTELLAAQANEVYVTAATNLAEEAARYVNAPGLSYDVARKLNLLRNGLTMPAPQDPQ